MSKKWIPSPGTVLSVGLSAFAVYSVMSLSVRSDGLALATPEDAQHLDAEALGLASDADLSTVMNRLRRLERSAAENAEQRAAGADTATGAEDDDLSNAPLLAQTDDLEVIRGALEQAFAQRDSDSSSTARFYQLLDEQMRENPEIATGTSIGALDCSATSCVVQFLHDNEAAAENTRSRVRTLFPWSQAGHITNEGLVSTAYISSDVSVFEGILVAAQ